MFSIDQFIESCRSAVAIALEVDRTAMPSLNVALESAVTTRWSRKLLPFRQAAGVKRVEWRVARRRNAAFQLQASHSTGVGCLLSRGARQASRRPSTPVAHTARHRAFDIAVLLGR